MNQKQKIMNSTMLTNESGRSMVEILGVLAIIGVLSVGGIYEYTIAMNKHKANELLNEASKRAVVVATQLAVKEKASLSEFAGQTVPGGTFANETEIEADANDQFSINISDVSKGVCEQMGNAAGRIIRKFEADCDYGTIRLTFNKDLGTGTGTDSGASANTLADQIAAVLNNGGCDGDCPEGLDIVSTNGVDSQFNCNPCSEELYQNIKNALGDGYGCVTGDETYFMCTKCGSGTDKAFGYC